MVFIDKQKNSIFYVLLIVFFYSGFISQEKQVARTQ